MDQSSLMAILAEEYTTTSYSRTVMEYADAWAEVLA